MSVRNNILVLIMLVLAAFVFQTAVRIEVLNAQAGYYLPRKDRNPDGAFSDGKWRISQENTPRDQLRGVVRTFGLPQYVLAPLLLTISALASKKSKQRWAKVAGFIVMLAAVIAIWLMLHREYYQSLGA